ncbi:hypothetical protein L484_009799 [Morus notabilis]|uniref:Uncharacterized protein n=1 Tax=Morus notabilis TaxID=981085 RepID=W9SJP8_9ROSA|nr:hypothetical protein L484_009799 [Morus notabilis]
MRRPMIGDIFSGIHVAGYDSTELSKTFRSGSYGTREWPCDHSLVGESGGARWPGTADLHVPLFYYCDGQSIYVKRKYERLGLSENKSQAQKYVKGQPSQAEKYVKAQPFVLLLALQRQS